MSIQNHSINCREFCAQLIKLESSEDQLLDVARGLVERLHKEYTNSPPQLSMEKGVDDWIECAQWFCKSTQVQVIDQLHPDRGESLRILARYAPLGLLPGCVMQNMANPANCHLPLAAHMHSAHALLVGSGLHSQNLAHRFRHLLEQVGLFLPLSTSTLFEQQAEVPVSSWQIPAYWLSLSLFPERCAPEILGAACCECLYGVPRLVAAAQQCLVPQHPFLSSMRQRQQAALPSLRAALQELLRDDIEGVLAERVVGGFTVSVRMLQEWEQGCRVDLLQGRCQPARAMVELVRNKARFAVGYHGKLKLAKQPFDELILQDAERFVEELGRSRWISPGRPEDSLLLTRLLAFGGPMFRVFSDEEEAAIRDWISSLTRTAAAPLSDVDASLPSSLSAPVTLTLVPSLASSSAAPDVPMPSVRDLYHQLLNLEQYPQVRHSAAAFCNRWLARSARGVFKDDNALPFDDYSHQALRAWFEMRAAVQVQSYTADSVDSEKSREDVIDEALQLCPMILIDGAWLQRWGNAGLVETPIGALLYKILSDEIGNGDTALNHPNIYRALMRQMGVVLPNFRSREFAHFARFKDAAFEVPVFWLCISLFPQRYIAETLGLNLAMELSGVGGAYRTARDELHQHGFSTLFVDLHNTIDNVSTGHSAMALRAIELWMDQALRNGDARQVRNAWLRVWTGFRALAAPSRHWREWIRPVRYAY